MSAVGGLTYCRSVSSFIIIIHFVEKVNHDFFCFSGGKCYQHLKR